MTDFNDRTRLTDDLPFCYLCLEQFTEEELANAYEPVGGWAPPGSFVHEKCFRGGKATSKRYHAEGLA